MSEKRKRGRPREVEGFRSFCRSVVSNPEVQAAIAEAALKNPEFALRVAEHGYGRPPQALDVRTSEVAPGEQVIYRAAFDDGQPVFTAAETVPEEPAE